jgi:hypothetical protein
MKGIFYKASKSSKGNYKRKRLRLLIFRFIGFSVPFPDPTVSNDAVIAE